MTCVLCLLLIVPVHLSRVENLDHTPWCRRMCGTTCARSQRREDSGVSKKQDVEKARFWQRRIREAARSGLSTREFCRQRRLHESQFYW